MFSKTKMSCQDLLLSTGSPRKSTNIIATLTSAIPMLSSTVWPLLKTLEKDDCEETNPCSSGESCMHIAAYIGMTVMRVSDLSSRDICFKYQVQPDDWCARISNLTFYLETYARLYRRDPRVTVFHVHPREQATVTLESGLVALTGYVILPIVHTILGLHGGKKLSTKARYRHNSDRGRTFKSARSVTVANTFK